MRHSISILFLMIFFVNCYSQQLISKDKAIDIAIKEGIKEPIDSFVVTLKSDSIWEVQSLYCDDYYGTKSETFSIDAVLGEKLKLFCGSQSIKWHSHPKPRTEINYDYIDSLIVVNESLPKQLLPDYFEHESRPRISPDNKWIAFDCGFRAIAIASIDGKDYRKICDSCLFPEWTEKENILVYEKDFKSIYQHNIVTNEIVSLTNNEGRYSYFSYCPRGDWVSYVKAVKPPGQTFLVSTCAGENNELFVLSLKTGIEKRLTTGGYVHNPIWQRYGDTIFFYKHGKPYFATNLDSDSVRCDRAANLDKVNICDYTNSCDSNFLYKQDCQLVLVNKQNLKSEKYILKKRARYEEYELSRDGKLITFTIDKVGKKKIYIVENE